jgi:hypothetical protein
MGRVDETKIKRLNDVRYGRQVRIRDLEPSGRVAASVLVGRYFCLRLNVVAYEI